MDAPSARQTDLAALPLFAQALVAVRLARRAALAMLDGPQQAAALAACEAMEAVARDGDGCRRAEPIVAPALKARRTRDTEAALEAVRWAWDSLSAAQGSLDFPVDSTVTASARRAITAVTEDGRISAIQVAIILAADIDQTDFACREASIQKYNGVTAHVLGRLTPCHALTLNPRPRNIEEEYR